MNRLPLTLGVLAAGLITACSTLPEADPALEAARAAHDAARDNPSVATYAQLEYRRADDEFHRAESAWLNHEDRRDVDHLAYLAQRRAEIALEAAQQKASEAAIANATAERDRVRLEARTREAEAAQRTARLAQQQAETTRRQALEAQQQAALAQQQAESSRAQAQALQQQAADADAKARALATQLQDLQTRITERGLVITLGDVLFETGNARLREPGVRAVHRLAAFMQQYPQRKVAIEGYTDSVGGETYNLELSERRANAIRLALLDSGIAADRIVVRGYGKAFPIASNSDPTGRQMNRRVEIVVSDDDGRIPPRLADIGNRFSRY